MKLRLENDGSIKLPAEVRGALGLSAGDEVCLEPCDGGFKLSHRESSRTQEPAPTADQPAAAGGLKEVVARKNLQTPMQVIKGVGPKLSELLAKRGVRNVEDA